MNGQLTLFDLEKAITSDDSFSLFPKIKEDFILNQITIRNFGKVHGERCLKFNHGINIVMPREDNKYEIDTALNIKDILNPYGQIAEAEEFYFNNIGDILKILRGKRDFCELEDLSYFESEKDISAELIYSEERNMSTFVKGLRRRKKYRGKEWIYTLNKEGSWKRSSTGSDESLTDEYKKDFKEVINKIKVYPEDLDFHYFSRVKHTGSFDFIKDIIDQDKLLEDANTIFMKYGIDSSLGYDLNGNIVVHGEDEKLFELVMLIAYEKQLNTPTVILSSRFGLNSLYDGELNEALHLLEEFEKNSQQIIVFYQDIWGSNLYPLDYWIGIKNKIRRAHDKEKINLVYFDEEYMPPREWQFTIKKQRARKLIRMHDLSFEDKVKLAKSYVLEAYKLSKAKRPTLSVSFGKDSMVMLDIVHRVVCECSLPKPALVFNNTGVEFPEHIKFAKKETKRLEGLGYTVHWVEPKNTFWKIVKEAGFPMFGKGIRKKTHSKLWNKIHKLGIKTCGNRCCLALKENPTKEFYETHKIDLAFIGNLADENYHRKDVFLRKGEFYWYKDGGYYKSTPIIHFKESDIWKYIKTYNVPTSPLYNMGFWKYNPDTGEEEYITYRRTGCWPCSMQISYDGNNIEMLRNTHPHLWKLLVVKKGLGKEIYKFKHNISEDKWKEHEEEFKKNLDFYFEYKPCHFDKAS